MLLVSLGLVGLTACLVVAETFYLIRNW